MSVSCGADPIVTGTPHVAPLRAPSTPSEGGRACLAVARCRLNRKVRVEGGASAPTVRREYSLARNHCNVPEHERGDSAHHCCLGRGVIASEGLPRQGWTRWWSVRARNWWRGAGGPSLCPWPHVFCRRKPTGRRAELRGPGEHDGAARVGLRSVRAPQRVGSRGACGRRGGAGSGSTPQPARRKPIENRFFATSAFGRFDLETHFGASSRVTSSPAKHPVAGTGSGPATR